MAAAAAEQKGGPTLTLPDGSAMPAIGLGTWGGADSGDVVAAAVRAALEAGFRAIDCAELYGNEREIGIALGDFLGAGAATREEVFVTSKVWNTNHAPEHVREACLNTLENLQLEYLDLYLVHWPLAWEYSGKAPFPNKVPQDSEGKVKMANVGLHQTWAAMESLVDEGKVKRIGVSNFSSLLLGDLLSYARIRPACNQVEMHPYLQQRNLVKFCQKHSIVVSGYAPLGRPGQHKDGPVLLEDEVVKRIAEAKSTTAATVVIAWAITRGTAPLPKSSNRGRLEQNLSAGALKLSEEEMVELDSLERGHHFCDYAWNHDCSLFD